MYTFQIYSIAIIKTGCQCSLCKETHSKFVTHASLHKLHIIKSCFVYFHKCSYICMYVFHPSSSTTTTTMTKQMLLYPSPIYCSTYVTWRIFCFYFFNFFTFFYAFVLPPFSSPAFVLANQIILSFRKPTRKRTKCLQPAPAARAATTRSPVIAPRQQPSTVLVVIQPLQQRQAAKKAKHP